MPCYAFKAERMPDFVTALQDGGYRVIAPVVRDAAVVYDEIESAAEMPVGVIDLQDNGSYRLQQGEQPTWFAYTVGPSSWKRVLLPPQEPLWESRMDEDGLHFHETPVDTRPTALLGVRSCELKALALHQKIFTQGTFKEERYQARRNACLIVAVSCTRAGATCFCASMGCGPRAGSGFDIALTEVLAGEQHFFLAETATEPGESVLNHMNLQLATSQELHQAAAAVADAAAHMGRHLEMDGLPQLLAEAHNHPHWAEVAKRCLNCANCTMVCPSCFCTTVVDATDLTGATSSRTRQWDSCFNLDFSYIHGGPVRKSGASRFRQWLTHKLSSWTEQFGEPGCTGCGRCITWCPVGIDITEEAARLREERSEYQNH